MVPYGIPRPPQVPQVARSDIDFAWEERKHGVMVTVKLSVNGVCPFIRPSDGRLRRDLVLVIEDLSEI
jgi:hypothetical protein